MQRDPIGLAGGDANLYRFTGNNAVNFIDPSGLFGIGDVVSGTLNLGYNLVAGDAGAVYEIGAMPIDVVGRAFSSRPWTPLSSFGEASQQALRDGVSPLQITGDFANENTLAITTLGVYPVVKAAKKSYDTGDPKEVEKAAGALLLGVAGARYLGRVNVGPRPRPRTQASSSPGGVGKPCPTPAQDAPRGAAQSAAEAAQVKGVRSVDPTPATKVAPRSLSERIADFRANPENWQRVSASAEQAKARSARGGISIENVYRNPSTGEVLHVHDVFKPSGAQIPKHPTFRDYGKGD